MSLSNPNYSNRDDFNPLENKNININRVQSAGDDLPLSNVDGVDIKIDSVERNIWQYILRHKLIGFIICVAIIVVGEYLIFTNFNVSLGADYNLYLLGLISTPFYPLLIWTFRLRKRFQSLFLEGFAKVNNYTFEKNGDSGSSDGLIYRLWGEQIISNVINGKYKNNYLKLLQCDLRVGENRDKKNYYYTVIELKLIGQLPNLLMMDKRSMRSHLGTMVEIFGTKNTYNLEGDFNKYFTLYGHPNFQIEALQIFTPDVMELMINKSKHYCVEFRLDRVYVYFNGHINNIKDLTQAFALVKKLSEKLAPVAGRMRDNVMLAMTPLPTAVEKKKVNTYEVVLLVTLLFCIISLIATGQFMKNIDVFVGAILMFILALLMMFFGNPFSKYF